MSTSMGIPPSRLLVLTSHSTIVVPAIRKIFYNAASLQAEECPQATSQSPRRPIRSLFVFSRLIYPAWSEARCRSGQQADFRTQGHGRSVQGDEAAASYDVQHQVSDTAAYGPFSFDKAKQPHEFRETFSGYPFSC